MQFDQSMVGGQKNPFDLCGFDINEKALMIVCKLISDEHFEVEDLTEEMVRQCDKVVTVMNLDKYRAWYFSRSRLND